MRARPPPRTANGKSHDKQSGLRPHKDGSRLGSESALRRLSCRRASCDLASRGGLRPARRPEKIGLSARRRRAAVRDAPSSSRPEPSRRRYDRSSDRRGCPSPPTQAARSSTSSSASAPTSAARSRRACRGVLAASSEQSALACERRRIRRALRRRECHRRDEGRDPSAPADRVHRREPRPTTTAAGFVDGSSQFLITSALWPSMKFVHSDRNPTTLTRGNGSRRAYFCTAV